MGLVRHPGPRHLESHAFFNLRLQTLRRRARLDATFIFSQHRVLMSEKYLVTGGAGFIGRALCAELLSHCGSVRVLDSLIPQVHSDAGPELPPEVEFVKADIRDAAALDRALDGVDGVFHLAAEVGVGQSMYEIVRYTSCNDV